MTGAPGRRTGRRGHRRLDWVAGLTEALRHELTVRSEVAVCAVHPPFVDTPTARASGNRTGRTLRPTAR
ncbi:hypothetical protein, partial [Geodermatophilus maliterrae]